jgi:nitroreductase
MIETTPDAALLCDAVKLACRAPSLHNSQPWRWVGRGATLHLYADLSRAMPAADPLGREIYLSCGAVLDHFIVAMAAAGWDTDVQRFPDPHAPLHVAAIEFRPSGHPVTDTCRARAAAIRVRRTDRRAYEAPHDRVNLEVLLRQTTIPYHVMFDAVLDDARPRLSEASRLTEAIRQNDPTYAAELAWWVTSFAPTTPQSCGAPPSADRSGGVDVRRSFPVTSHNSAEGDCGVDHSMIAVLSTSNEDARHDVLRCGEALSRVLLECTMAEMATCTLTHMTELAQSREVIRRLTGQRGMPQLLIRIGEATPEADVAMTPRRPLSDVLEFRD